MFDDAQPQLEKILALVQLCPEKLQERCFELLLSAYLDSQEHKSSMPGCTSQENSVPKNVEEKPGGSGSVNVVPDAIRTRFKSLAARTKVSESQAAGLFDFNVDPFTFHAVSIPGNSNREKMRNVALLLSLKSYLTAASWEADWKEFRAACLDYSCWDRGNSFTTMNYEWFKTASAAENISLSPSGVKAADALFAKLAMGEDSQSS